MIATVFNLSLEEQALLRSWNAPGSLDHVGGAGSAGRDGQFHAQDLGCSGVAVPPEPSGLRGGYQQHQQAVGDGRIRGR